MFTDANRVAEVSAYLWILSGAADAASEERLVTTLQAYPTLAATARGQVGEALWVTVLALL